MCEIIKFLNSNSGAIMGVTSFMMLVVSGFLAWNALSMRLIIKENAQRMRKISEENLYEIGIRKKSEQLVASLSGGERQAVALGRVFHFGTKVLLLDEPTTGLSIKEVDRSLRRIKTVRDKTSIPIIFVTHNVRHIFPIADRIVVLDRGEKSCDKKTEDTTIDEIVQLIAKEKIHLH